MYSDTLDFRCVTWNF